MLLILKSNVTISIYSLVSSIMKISKLLPLVSSFRTLVTTFITLEKIIGWHDHWCQDLLYIGTLYTLTNDGLAMPNNVEYNVYRVSTLCKCYLCESNATTRKRSLIISFNYTNVLETASEWLTKCIQPRVIIFSDEDILLFRKETLKDDGRSYEPSSIRFWLENKNTSSDFF